MNPFILRYNNFLFGNITATDTASGYDINNIRDWRDYTYWVAASHGTKYITLDGSGNYKGNTLGIAGHNLGTAAAKVTIDYYKESTGTWETALSEFDVTSDKPLVKTFTEQEAYDWRIKIVTASIAPRIGVLMLSQRTEFPSAPEAPLVNKSLTPLSEAYESESGYLLGIDHKYTKLEINHTYKLLTATFVDSTFLPMWEAHLKLGYPFFYAVDLVNSPLEAWWVRMKKDFVLAPDKTIKDYYESLSLGFEGVY